VHRRLAVIDPSWHSRQPMVDSDTGLSIVRACHLMALLLDVQHEEILPARERALADLQKSVHNVHKGRVENRCPSP
jgi:hypothetical protein